MNKKRIENKKNTPSTPTTPSQIGSMFAESLLPALKEGHTQHEEERLRRRRALLLFEKRRGVGIFRNVGYESNKRDE